MGPGRLPVAPGGAWDGSGWRPGRSREWIWAPNLCQNYGFYGFLVPSGPKFVPKLRVLWFFGPERPQEPPLSVETPGDCADGPKREFGVGTARDGFSKVSEFVEASSQSMPGVAPPKLRKVRTAPKWGVATSGFDKPDFLAQIWHNLFSDS